MSSMEISEAACRLQPNHVRIPCVLHGRNRQLHVALLWRLSTGATALSKNSPLLLWTNLLIFSAVIECQSGFLDYQ